jgi:hypothetical protein
VVQKEEGRRLVVAARAFVFCKRRDFVWFGRDVFFLLCGRDDFLVSERTGIIKEGGPLLKKCSYRTRTVGTASWHTRRKKSRELTWNTWARSTYYSRAQHWSLDADVLACVGAAARVKRSLAVVRNCVGVCEL